MKLLAGVLSVVFVTTAPTLLFAKGDTVKITIESAALAAPIASQDGAGAVRSRTPPCRSVGMVRRTRKEARRTGGSV